MITLNENEYSALREQAQQLAKMTDELIAAQSLIKDISESASALIWMSGSDEKYHYFNQAFLEFTGKQLGELAGFGWIDSVYPEDASHCISAYRNAFAEQQSFEVVYRLKRHDGEYRWMICHGAPRFTGEKFVGFIGHCLDFTRHKRNEILGKTRSEALSQVAKGMPLKLILNTIVSGIEEAKPEALCSIQLLEPKTLKLKNGAAPSLPGFYTKEVEKLSAGIGVGSCGTAAITGEVVIAEDLNTHPYWQEFLQLTQKAGLQSCWSAPIFSAQGDILGTLSIYHREPHTPREEDYTIIRHAADLAGIAIDRDRDTERLNQLATTDYLTGLTNRRVFYEKLQSEISRVQRSLNPASLLILDVDHFKAINDRFGHAAGDMALKTFADLIRQRLRDTDVAARLGGEEFALLLPGANAEAAHQFAESLRQGIELTELNLENSLSIKVTVSIGIAQISPQSDEEQVMNLADQALYQAKNAGRNQVCVATDHAA